MRNLLPPPFPNPPGKPSPAESQAVLPQREARRIEN